MFPLLSEHDSVFISVPGNVRFFLYQGESAYSCKTGFENTLSNYHQTLY